MSPSEDGKGLVIREAVPEEAPLILEMIRAIAAYTGEAARVRSTAGQIARDGFGPGRAFSTLLALLDGRPVGMAIHYPEYSTWRGQRGACLLDLYVAPAARRHGVGRRLVVETACLSAGRGGRFLRLSVAADNALARGFYATQGFTEAAGDRQLFLDGAAFEALTR
jgi:ribosomal protein S18 acetylase RimI-like enzyme